MKRVLAVAAVMAACSGSAFAAGYDDFSAGLTADLRGENARSAHGQGGGRIHGVVSRVVRFQAALARAACVKHFRELDGRHLYAQGTNNWVPFVPLVLILFSGRKVKPFGQAGFNQCFFINFCFGSLGTV